MEKLREVLCLLMHILPEWKIFFKIANYSDGWACLDCKTEKSASYNQSYNHGPESLMDVEFFRTEIDLCISFHM